MLTGCVCKENLGPGEVVYKSTMMTEALAL